MSRDELAVLDGGKCILQLRGVRPFLSDKYDLTQHPNYKLTSDYDPKNTFDIEKYLNRKEKINPMIGAAGISAFPMSSRVIQKMAQQEDPTNILLMHAAGANVSGQVASVIAGGLVIKLVTAFL